MKELIDFFPTFLNMSLIAGIVIIFVIAARLVLRKAPKIFSYALWAIVLVRLLVPVTIPSPVSAIPEIPVANDVQINKVLPEIEFETPSERIENEQAFEQAEQNNGVVVTVTRSAEPTAYLTIVWLIGIGAMLMYSFISFLIIRRKLKVVVPMRDQIFIADDIQSPFVIGLIRPKIYLPSNLNEREQAYIILHEQHHIRRGDHIIKVLAFLALCLHWFNPLVWVAFHLASKDMEMSCDEAVVRKLGSHIRADYSASLLTLATGRRIIAGTPLAFGEGDPKGRIRNLAKWKKPALWVIVIAVILCAVLAVCLLTDPLDKADVGRTYYYGTVIDEKTGSMESDGPERDIVTVDCLDGTERTFWIWDPKMADEEWLGKSVKLRGESEAHNEILYAYEIEAADPVMESSLEEAINSAIISHNWSSHDQGGYPCASFVRLAGQERGDRITVYGLALYQAYSLHYDVLVEESGSHIPVALTFHRSDSGAYALAEYWEPRDGSYYTDDIRAKFPAFVWPDTQEYIDSQIQNCYAQAVAHFGLDVNRGISSSATANGFEIKLYSEKAAYSADEEIKLWATLEYQGEGDTVTIWHGLPYMSFSLTDGADFNTGGMIGTILTSTELDKGRIYKFDYVKSGAYGEDDPDAAFWRDFYQDEELRLPAGTYTVSVSGDFFLSPEQRPGEQGPTCELQITVTDLRMGAEDDIIKPFDPL